MPSRLPWLALAAAVGLWLVGLVVPAVAVYPERLEVSTSAFWAEAIRWLNVNFFDAFEAIKIAVLTHLLLPVRRFLVAIPWWWGTLLAEFCLFIAFTGYRVWWT